YSLLLSSFPRHCSVILRPPAPPLFPYTTLFRSILTTPEGARKVDTAPLKAACGSAEEDRGLVVAGLRHRLEPAEGILERHGHDRSEEHTSELQSRENLVCRLLLEKKKISECRCT